MKSTFFRVSKVTDLSKILLDRFIKNTAKPFNIANDVILNFRFYTCGYGFSCSHIPPNTSTSFLKRGST